MASKALARFDWNKILSTINPKDVPKMNRLKAQMDATAVKCSQLPESLPKIDWAHYKTNSANPKAVEQIEKLYNSIKLERPKAAASCLDELNEANECQHIKFKKFVEAAQTQIDSAEVVKQKFLKMIPVDDMTSEEWYLTFPYWSLTKDNPSGSPHYGRAIGLSREEAILFEQPDPYPYANKQAWKDWEVRKKKFYS